MGRTSSSRRLGWALTAQGRGRLRDKKTEDNGLAGKGTGHAMSIITLGLPMGEPEPTAPHLGSSVHMPRRFSTSVVAT